jgi:hypothetical protein
MAHEIPVPARTLRAKLWQTAVSPRIIKLVQETYQGTDEIAWIIEKDRLFWPTLEFGIRGQESQAQERGTIRFRGGMTILAFRDVILVA